MFEFKERYNIDDLIRIVRILRSENGCPWDRVQTHKSIKRDFIEEVYEVDEIKEIESEFVKICVANDIRLSEEQKSNIEMRLNKYQNALNSKTENHFAIC